MHNNIANYNIFIRFQQYHKCILYVLIPLHNTIQFYYAITFVILILKKKCNIFNFLVNVFNI